MSDSKCPIDYDWDRCSSKEYGLTCKTCVNYDETAINMKSEFKFDLDTILKMADEMGIKYELNNKDAGFFTTDKDGIQKKISVEELFGFKDWIVTEE